MTERVKQEGVEKAVNEANSPEKEVGNKKVGEEQPKEEKEERAVLKSSDEKRKKAEVVGKNNEAGKKEVDEKEPAAAKKEVVEKEQHPDEESPESQTAKEQKDKELPKKVPISSFFGKEGFAWNNAFGSHKCAFISNGGNS